MKIPAGSTSLRFKASTITMSKCLFGFVLSCLNFYRWQSWNTTFFFYQRLKCSSCWLITSSLRVQLTVITNVAPESFTTKLLSLTTVFLILNYFTSSGYGFYLRKKSKCRNCTDSTCLFLREVRAKKSFAHGRKAEAGTWFFFFWGLHK